MHDRHTEVALRLLATAERLDAVTRQTEPERAELFETTEAVSNAEVRHRIVQRKLDEASWPHRRALRRELNACEVGLDSQRSHLGDVAARTSEATQQYKTAWALHQEAIDDAHSLHLATILDGWHLQPPTAAARVDALDTWRSWAAGRPLSNEHLDDAVATLAEWNHADVRLLIAGLAESGIEPPTSWSLEPAGNDLDL